MSKEKGIIALTEVLKQLYTDILLQNGGCWLNLQIQLYQARLCGRQILNTLNPVADLQAKLRKMVSGGEIFLHKIISNLKTKRSYYNYR